MLDRWRSLREAASGDLGTREHVLLDVVDRLAAVEGLQRDNARRLGRIEGRLALTPNDKPPDAITAVEFKVASVGRTLEDLDHATTAAIADNATRIIEIEAKLADQ